MTFPSPLASFTIASLLFAATLAASETDSRLIEAAKRGDAVAVCYSAR